LQKGFNAINTLAHYTLVRNAVKLEGGGGQGGERGGGGGILGGGRGGGGWGGQAGEKRFYFVILAEEYYVFVFELACACARKHKDGPKLDKIRDSVKFMFTIDQHVCPKSCIQKYTRMRAQKTYLCSLDLCQR